MERLPRRLAFAQLSLRNRELARPAPRRFNSLETIYKNSPNSMLQKLHPLLMTILVAAVTVISSVVSAAFSPEPNSLNRHLLQAIPPLALFMFLLAKNRDSPLVFQTTLIPRYVLWLIPWLFTLPLLTLFSVDIFPKSAVVFNVIAMCSAIALWEEILFRGIFFQGLQNSKFPVYLLLSSLLFGALHYDNGMEFTIHATVIGMGFGLARLSGCPLYILILCHTAIGVPYQLLDHVDSEVKPPEIYNHIIYIIRAASSVTFIMGLCYLLLPRHWAHSSSKQ